MRFTLVPVSLLALSLAACGGSEPAGDPELQDELAIDGMEAVEQQKAVATLVMADGTEVGTATATGSAGGITIHLEAMGLEPGLHGVHVHDTGSCTPDFAAAGGHWNPGETTHGLEGDDGQHAGDMPNLEEGEDGTGSLSYMLSIDATWDGLMVGDGSAFIIHAGEDDQMTDPSGDSGDRIACGVFEAPAA